MAEPSCLPNGARKGAVATSPGKLMQADPGISTQPWGLVSELQENLTLLRGNFFRWRFLSELCYSFLSLQHHILPSANRKGFSPNPDEQCHANKNIYRSINSNKYVSTQRWQVQDRCMDNSRYSFPALRGTRPSQTQHLSMQGLYSSALWDHTVPLFWYLLNHLRPTGTTGQQLRASLRDA